MTLAKAVEAGVLPWPPQHNTTTTGFTILYPHDVMTQFDKFASQLYLLHSQAISEG
jgi:hypothetical protein